MHAGVGVVVVTGRSLIGAERRWWLLMVCLLVLR